MPQPFSFPEFLAISGDIAYDWDLLADRLSWFGAQEKLFGATAPLNAQAFHNLIHPADRHLVFGRGADVANNREYRLHTPQGVVRVQERGAPELENGRLVRQRGILRIIDKMSDGIALAPEFQSQDALTGYPDRQAMQARLSTIMESAQATGQLSAYLVIGVDKMSVVNEAVGMEIGDALLRGVAARLTELIPPRAILGRVGGDMFGIILPESLGAELNLLTETVLESFRDDPIMTAVAPLHITVSIGAVRLPTMAKNATEAMIFAEQALHDAHQQGRNLLVEYLDKPERAQEHRQLLDLSGRIKHAFRHDGFRLAFQPIIETATGKPVCYEALVRMFDDDGAPVAAAKFVPVIEQIGLAQELDRHVLDLAIKELEAAPDLCLAINISGLTAVHADWPDHLYKVLQPRPDVARRIIIEITETAAIVDVTETKRFVAILRELGGRVSLDDFGAGFTSIRHLRSLSLSIMKIDKELLHNVVENPEQQHLVRMLIELARGLGLQTVAEGVETADVAAWLRREKVDMMQGYYFGKPALERSWRVSEPVKSVGGAKIAPIPKPYKLPQTGQAASLAALSDITMDPVVFV